MDRPDFEGDPQLGAFPPGAPMSPEMVRDHMRNLPGFVDASELHLASDQDGPDDFVPQPQVEPADEADEFDPRHEQDVLGLIYLGGLSTEVDVWGHRIVIRTLRVGEELQVKQLAGEHEGNVLAQGQALWTATVAAAIVTVDGSTLVAPLGPDDKQTSLRQKYDYVREKWYWPVIEAIWGEYNGLLLRQATALQELEGKSQAGRNLLMPTFGSPTDRESSTAT